MNIKKLVLLLKLKLYFYSVTLPLFAIIIIVCSFFSCITPKKVKYLQDKNQVKIETVFENKRTPYRVQPKDYLYIKLSSVDLETNQYLNAQFLQSTGALGGSSITRNLYTYIVNDSGYILLPQVGKLLVTNYTLEEIRIKIEQSLSKYFVQFFVDVRLDDFFITVLGEVKNPGRHDFYNERITIFDAIGASGDLTEIANRKRINLIRQTPKGTNIYYFDLTEKDFLKSEMYYLKPNDIIYVEPLSAGFWNQKYIPFISIIALIISTTTSVVYFYNLVK